MKIAIYGGAFNPVHNEHINIVKAAKETLGLDRVIIMPSSISPQKRGEKIVRGKERFEMCNLAFCGIDGAEVSDYELKRGGISYSYITCRHFKKLYPDDELFFIIGGDSLKDFFYWKEPEEILKCVTLAVCARVEESELKNEIKKFYSEFKREIVTFGYVGKNVSSTRIRVLAALGEDISKYTSAAVKKYIFDKKLYKIPEITRVKEYLTKERWQHTVGVAVMAAENCRRLKVPEEDAVIAATLHDCAKYLGESAPELTGFKPPENVPAPVLHQYSGAYVAEHTFGITDENILNAIRYHTSGRENMRPLEKLIFLADLLEEGRDYEGVEDLRKIFRRDIDGCLEVSLKKQLERLEKIGGEIYPLTRRAYEYIKENL